MKYNIKDEQRQHVCKKDIIEKRLSGCSSTELNTVLFQWDPGKTKTKEYL